MNARSTNMTVEDMASTTVEDTANTTVEDTANMKAVRSTN